MGELTLIDLDIPSLGFYKFISCWLYHGSEGNFIVDPGPTCTVDVLCSELKRQGIKYLDWILLTHIHIDHAGCIGHLSQKFPEAGIVCHTKAISHLIEPSRLWKGSLKNLGELAKIYGQIKPVEKDRLFAPEQIPLAEGIKVIETPGHAPHHLCFVYRDWLFVGELFGVFQKVKGSIYIRPATPPRFIAKVSFESMDRVTPYFDRIFCFGHYGSYPKGRKIAVIARDQLKRWISVCTEHLDDPDPDVIMIDLMKKDSIFNQVNQFSADAYQREKYFIKDAIWGIVQWLMEK